MKILESSIALALGVALGLGWSNVRSDPEAMTAEKEGRITAEVVRASNALIRAQAEHDVEGILAAYDDGPAFLYAGVDEVRSGWEPFRMATELWHRRHPEVELRAEIVETRVLGPDVALVVSRGSSSAAGPMAWTRVLVRNAEDRWVVVLEHEAWREAPAGSGFHDMAASMPGATAATGER